MDNELIRIGLPCWLYKPNVRDNIVSSPSIILQEYTPSSSEDSSPSITNLYTPELVYSATFIAPSSLLTGVSI